MEIKYFVAIAVLSASVCYVNCQKCEFFDSVRCTFNFLEKISSNDTNIKEKCRAVNTYMTCITRSSCGDHYGFKGTIAVANDYRSKNCVVYVAARSNSAGNKELVNVLLITISVLLVK